MKIAAPRDVSPLFSGTYDDVGSREFFLDSVWTRPIRELYNGGIMTRNELTDDGGHFWGLVFSFWSTLALLWWILATEFYM